MLRQAPIFAELSLEELRLVNGMCRRVRYKPGEVLIEQNVLGLALFVLISGHVEIRSKRPDGRVAIVATAGPGAHLGEISLIESAPTSASVIAGGRCARLPLGKGSLQRTG